MNRFASFFAAIFFLVACSTSAVPVISTIVPPQTFTLTPTQIQATDTPAPTEPTTQEYDAKAEKEKQQAIIDNTPNRIVDSTYLSSPEYLAMIKAKDKAGELPQISPGANFLTPGAIKLVFNDPELIGGEKFFKKYGVISAITMPISKTWWSFEKQPFVIVDSGTTQIGDAMLAFKLVKWGHSDRTSGYIGFYNLVENGDMTANDIRNQAGVDITYSNTSYMVPQFYNGANGCMLSFQMSGISYWRGVNDFCNSLGKNSESSLPKELLTNWSETGILTNSDTITWSSGVRLQK